MLLCAVGYGRNDEYVGSSWSLNTAKDALEKGIFCLLYTSCVFAWNNFVGQLVYARIIAALVGKAGDLGKNAAAEVVYRAVDTSHWVVASLYIM